MNTCMVLQLCTLWFTLQCLESYCNVSLAVCVGQCKVTLEHLTLDPTRSAAICSYC